jgi:hypothetical protein
MKMRMTRRGAGLLIALMLIAIPAAAAVMTQNFMRADITLNDACFVKEAGSDAAGASGFVSFDGSQTIVASGGTVDLLQEEVSVSGFAGDRLIYTDTARFVNNCTSSVSLRLISASDPAAGPAVDPAVVAGSIWESMDVYVYVATAATPAGDPSATNPDWALQFSVVAGVVSPQVNAVTIPNAGSRRLAFVIDTDSAWTGAESGTLRWTATATHS